MAARTTFRLRQTLATGSAALIGVAVLAGTIFLGFGGAGEAAPQRTTTATAPGATNSAAPSEAATMICSPSTRASIAVALGLPESPVPVDEWRYPTYRCTYDLPAGTLVLTVREFSDASAAVREFESRRGTLGDGDAITGVASFGLPAFQANSGTVLFAKDNMTLEVDATGMATMSGPEGLSRTELAYQVSTNVLACWRAHH